MSSFGPDMSASPRLTMRCWPPERVPAGCVDLSSQDREQVVDELEARGVLARIGDVRTAEQEVVEHREIGEDEALGGMRAIPARTFDFEPARVTSRPVYTALPPIDRVRAEDRLDRRATCRCRCGRGCRRSRPRRRGDRRRRRRACGPTQPAAARREKGNTTVAVPTRASPSRRCQAVPKYASASRASW